MVNLYSVVAYGTFITKGYWKDKKNVEICKVSGFKRILPEGNWFPYVIPNKNSFFWALKFDVTNEELQTLDFYEGTSMGLYKRTQIEVILKDGVKKKAFIYIPTEKTIKKKNLTLKIDIMDNWKKEIRKNPEIVEKFPELVE